MAYTMCDYAHRGGDCWSDPEAIFAITKQLRRLIGTRLDVGSAPPSPPVGGGCVLWAVPATGRVAWRTDRDSLGPGMHCDALIAGPDLFHFSHLNDAPAIRWVTSTPAISLIFSVDDNTINQVQCRLGQF